MLRDKLNLALIAGIVIAVCGILIYSPASVVMAVGTSDAIHIVDKGGNLPVTTITFPQGEPGATVSAPYNDVNGDTDPQVLDALASEPVVKLHNTSVDPLTVWLQISPWTEAVVGEDYELVPAATVNVKIVDNELSAAGGGAQVNTGIEMPAGTYMALYLAVDLGPAGTSGTSMLTILGE